LAQRVYVHVGTPKSGTTYLQAGLWQHRHELCDLGVLFPGRGPFDQNRASIAVRNGRHLRSQKPLAPIWSRILRQTEEFDGTVVLSNEWYLAASQQQAAAAVDQLGGDNVRVVITTRSLVRLVPAAWQESLKVGRGHSLAEFVEGLTEGRTKWTWDVLDPATVAQQWAQIVGPDRVHVVTMPETPTHPGQLWERFAGTIGFDPHVLELPPRGANESLSVQAARLMQEFGPALREEVDRHDSSWRGHARWLRKAVVRQTLANVPGAPIGVGESLRSELDERANRSVAALRDLRSPIVGDLDELTGGTDRPGSRHPDSVTPEELLDVSRQLAVGLLSARIHDLTDRDPTTGPDRVDESDRDQEDPGRSALEHVPSSSGAPEFPDAEDTVEATHAPRRSGQHRPPGVDYADTVATRRRDVRGRTRRWTFMVPSAYAAGGIARTVFTTANTLAARGHDVRILTLSRSAANPKFELDPAVELVALQDRFDPERPDRPRRAARKDHTANPRLRELDSQPSRLVDGAKKTFSSLVDHLLREQLSDRPPGVIVSTRPEFAVAASLWSDPGSILLHQEHLSFVPRPEPLRAALRDLALGRAPSRPIDALLTLTHADLERWEAYLGEPRPRTGVIPNPTPFPVGDAAPLANPVVIAAGRLTAQKGFERLVDAYVPLARSHPEWQLRIYGDGQRWKELNAQVEAAGVGDRILMGGVTDQLESELAESSIYAMSSRYEGLPMVLLEALSKGVPPVSFDCPEGPRQLIADDVNGLLVPEGDVPALTEALRRLMDDPGLRRRLGAQALETAREYQAEAVTDRWISLAEEVAAERGAE
jgi:glycosyltransferase involved in cell wall biosynthesis